jgi:hypothetical protein
MKTPQLKGFDCFDHDPIDEWSPESDSDVFFSLCLHIGPPDEAGADLFYVDVRTPQEANESNRGMRVSQRRIVVNPYSWEASNRCERYLRVAMARLGENNQRR